MSDLITVVPVLASPTDDATPQTRWRLDISYDGTAFAGWAIQPGQRTVQGELEQWVPQVLRLNAPVTVMCAGRTDAGVHARGQVAHVDLPADLTIEDGATLMRRLDRVLRRDVVVRSVAPAPHGFHARFSAIWRRYTYRIGDGETAVDPLMRHQVTSIRDTLDLDVFNEAAQTLLGLRNFGAFCRRRAGATTTRTLLDLHAHRVTHGPLAGTVDVTVRADAFCHSMVRSLMGALTFVGTGRRTQEWLNRVTTAAVRDSHVEVMAARGLTLEEVAYPPDDQLAERARVARSTREEPA